MKTVNRIVDLLELLSKYNNGLMISEISEEIDLPISTTHRMLNSLKKRGYITQDTITKRYKIGINILSLAIGIINNNDIVNCSRGYMEELSSKWQLLVFLAVAEHDKAICASMVNNSNKVKFFVDIGKEMPFHCAVSAQIIFAYRNDEEINKLLDGKVFEPYTPNTLVNPEDIKKKLYSIRSLGYGICNEEMEIGVKAIAVPIRNHSSNVVASLNIIGIKGNGEELDESGLIEDMQNAASQISRALGYMG